MADFEWVGMDRLPPKYSWTPVDRRAYIADMGMKGDQLLRQVGVDVPRARVFLQTDIRVKHPKLFMKLIQHSVHPCFVDEVFAMVTQTTLAQPLRALSKSLPESLYIAEKVGDNEDIGSMVIEIFIKDRTSVTVNVRKPLRIVRATKKGVFTVRNIEFVVFYDSTSPFVEVGLFMPCLSNENNT